MRRFEIPHFESRLSELVFGPCSELSLLFIQDSRLLCFLSSHQVSNVLREFVIRTKVALVKSRFTQFSPNEDVASKGEFRHAQGPGKGGGKQNKGL